MGNQEMYIISKITPVVLFEEKRNDYVLSSDFFLNIKLLEPDFHHLDYPKNISNGENQVIYPCDDFAFEKKILIGKNSELSTRETTPSIHLLNVCPCVQHLKNSNLVQKITIKLDGLLFSFIMIELQRSRTFRKNMLLKLYSQYKRKHKVFPSEQKSLCVICNRHVWKIHVLAFLSGPERNILDYKWNKKMQILINERCEYENAMAWLSTLGGAFSALGDSYLDFAKKAAIISVEQLHIALRLGDPITICRCKIYIAMSLLQRGYYYQTKKLIRKLYEFSTNGEGKKDYRLRNMCLAVWNRLRYVLSLKKAVTQS